MTQLSFNVSWYNTLNTVLSEGAEIAPRGQGTRELLHQTTKVDMRYPVLTNPHRKLSYQFMAAEAYWILTGDNTVAGIAPFNKHIAKFSDDGETFFGAYGPRIVAQLDHVTNTLERDQDTRQAGLTIWRENPPITRDVPCTIAIWFQLRDGLLYTSVFMRSSDVWLGLPYDVFNFSMLTHLICARLRLLGINCGPGILNLTAASSHLYNRDLEAATGCLQPTDLTSPYPTPELLHTRERELLETLMQLRTSRRGDSRRWWEDQL